MKEPFDLISDYSEKFEILNRTRIVNKTEPGGYSPQALADFALKKYEQEGNCLVIMNTKKSALDLYNAIKERVTDLENRIDLVFMSTHMCPQHRLDKIKHMKDKNQKNVLCISTQLIEAGVDISFDCVIRAIAGLDSIIQAAGRCNRSGASNEQKNVYIINVAGENLSMLPDIKMGQDITYRILDEDKYNISSPSAIRRYYEEFFDKKATDLYYKLQNNTYIYDLLSNNNTGCDAFINRETAPLPALRQAFSAAGKAFCVIEKNMVRVLVSYGSGKDIWERFINADLAERKRIIPLLGKYSVTLFNYEFTSLEKNGVLTQIGDELYYLTDTAFYDDCTGIKFEGVPSFLVV